ncbi:MAG: glycosyltransferase family 2 protein [Actinobacteria bacterium]|nr:MAG: glycosyltransferase family 2 protein [Actinomycetota bacterium]
MPTTSPFVTVLIGAYENEATVARAVGSILGQTETDLELIVIDDGSRDGSADAAREAIGDDPRGRVMRLEQNLGIARSLNAGMEAAAAPVVAIQDADDYSVPHRLERELAVLSADPEVAVVGSRMREVDASGRELRPRTSFAAGDVRPVLMRFNPIPNGSAAFRKDVALELGGYDPRYRYATEYDLWLRIAERHRLVALDEELATRVMGGGNVAARAERAQLAEGLRIRARALRRRKTFAGAGGLIRPALSYALPAPLKRALRERRGQAP